MQNYKKFTVNGIEVEVATCDDVFDMSLHFRQWYIKDPEPQIIYVYGITDPEDIEFVVDLVTRHFDALWWYFLEEECDSTSIIGVADLINTALLFEEEETDEPKVIVNYWGYNAISGEHEGGNMFSNLKCGYGYYKYCKRHFEINRPYNWRKFNITLYHDFPARTKPQREHARSKEEWDNLRFEFEIIG